MNHAAEKWRNVTERAFVTFPQKRGKGVRVGLHCFDGQWAKGQNPRSPHEDTVKEAGSRQAMRDFGAPNKLADIFGLLTFAEIAARRNEL